MEKIYIKWGSGSVLGRFGLQIRILREKLCRMMGSDLFFFINFWKFGYPASPGPGRPRAAISKLGFRNKLKISSRDRKWSLDHLACDQSCAGSNKTSFKSPELLCYFLVIWFPEPREGPSTFDPPPSPSPGPPPSRGKISNSRCPGEGVGGG